MELYQNKSTIVRQFSMFEYIPSGGATYFESLSSRDRTLCRMSFPAVSCTPALSMARAR